MHARRLSTAIVLVLGLVLAGPAAGAPVRPTHTWHVSLAGPAQFDLTLAELRFKGPGTPTLRLSLTRPAGLYYVAGALVRRPTSGGPRALVVVVNRRPRGSSAPDRSTIGLHVTGATALGAPAVRQLSNPFPAPVGSATTRRLCGLGKGHAASDLRAVLSAGSRLPGFSAAAALAEAYDIACGLPYDPAFAQGVTDCGTSLVAGCCPPNAMCVAPTPVPTPVPTPAPIPGPPVCGCPPRPCTVEVGCPLAPTRYALRLLACPLRPPAPCPA